MKASQAVALSFGLLWLRTSEGRRLPRDASLCDRRERYHNGSESDVGRIRGGAAPARLAHALADSQGSGRTACPSGTYNDPAGDSCQPCPLGSFASRDGSDRCTLCPSGSYTPVTGSSFCLPCDPSYYDGTGSDYGYTATSTSVSASIAPGGANSASDVVYCVAPLYPVNDTGDWTEVTEAPTSSLPSSAPTMAPSVLTSSSPPSEVPTIGGPSAVPTATTASTSRPSNPRRPQAHLPWPWHPPRSRPPSPGDAHMATQHPTVRRRWDFAEGARTNRTKGEETKDDEDSSPDSEDESRAFRPFLPLLALSAALALTGVLMAGKIYRQQQQKRRQLVVKTYSNRPSALPSCVPNDPLPPPPPPPPPLLPPTTSSLSTHSDATHTIFVGALHEVDSDSSSDYWSAGSLLGIEQCSSHGEARSTSSYESSYEEDSADYAVTLPGFVPPPVRVRIKNAPFSNT